jgi:dihydroorotate dehydrogenase
MSLILRGIDFGPVQDATGARGFFSGEEYPYHKIWKIVFGWLGFDLTGSTRVPKTSVLLKRPGKAKTLQDLITWIGFFQKCIFVDIFNVNAINAVSLTGPGLEALLMKGVWQKWTESFFLSVMSIADSKEERLAEHRKMFDLLKKHLPAFLANIGLQINVSCPNTGGDVATYASEAREILDIYAPLGIPLVIKLSVETPVEVAVKIAEHSECDAIVMGNTLKYGQHAPKSFWKNLYGLVSPLIERGVGLVGGLSGNALYPFIYEWIQEADTVGFPKPIIAGGGIINRKRIRELAKFDCVKAVALGTVIIARPWRLRGMIKEGYKQFSN